MTCAHMEGVIVRRRSGLSDTEQLELENHLAECAPCSEKVRHLDAMSALSDRMVSTLSSSKREQIITRALAFQEISVAPVSNPWLWGAAVAIAGLAALVALIVFFVPAGRARVRPAPAEDRPLPLMARGDTARGDTDHIIVAYRPKTVPLGHAKLRFTGQSRARWRVANRTVYLEAGGLEAKVDAAPNRFFRVQTGAFTVEVLGGVFRVDPRSVHVLEGQARVLDPEGRLVALLNPRQSWPGAEPKPGPVAKSAVEPEPEAPPKSESKASPKSSPKSESKASPKSESKAPPKSESKASPKSEPKAPPEPRPKSPTERRPNKPRPTTAAARPAAKRRPPSKKARRAKYAATLRTARRFLAEGRTGEARRLIRRIRSARGAPRHYRAEATMLLAECAAVHGDSAEAIRLYLEVADRYPSLPAAETALFAAARASTGGRATLLLYRYLTTYPDGRFAEAAHAHLGPRPRDAPQGRE